MVTAAAVDTPAFSLLVLLCLAGLLGARFGLAAVVEAPAEAAITPVAGEPVMALPPKPQGAETPPATGEGAGGPGSLVLTREVCDRYEAELRDVCLMGLAAQGAARDPQAALRVCAEIGDGELALECRSDVAEATALVDRAAAEAICAGIGVLKWRGQCHFGMGLALAETDAPYALARCEQAEVFRDFCRHDVVGEVALVDLEAAVAFCAREEGDTLTRKTCWHGIGKYLARRDFAEAAAACLRATEAWRGNCLHGVGWGASERDPDGALRGCAGVAPYTDNCQQGVAHQLKRADPERAVSLCQGIADPGISSRCLAFVTR